MFFSQNNLFHVNIFDPFTESVASVHTSANLKTMEDAIQSWLNHASDRKKKAEKKEDQRELLIEILIS